MKIAIVHDFLVRYGGAELLVKTWSEEFPEAPIFTLFYDEKKMGKFFPKKRIQTSYLQKFYNLTKSYTWLLPLMPFAIESFDLSEYDVILSSSAAFSHACLTTYEQKHISYVHSPMRWAWDYYFKFLKERKLNFLTKYLFKKIIFKLRYWDVVTASRPDVILVPSSAVQKRVEKYWNRESEILSPFVCLNTFCLPKTKIKGNYFLIVAQLVSYKKIDLAIRVCEELKIPLKIVGAGIERKKLEKLAGKYTQFLGAKYGVELVEIMQKAQAFLFLGEDDFGITQIEAMACGIPVVSYKRGGALDVIEEGISGVFFEDQSVKSLKKVLKDTDFSVFNSQKIRKSAERFSKKKHLDNLRQVVQ